MRNRCLVIVFLLMFCSGNTFAQEIGFKVTKQACLLISDYPAKLMNEIKELLLSKAKRDALGEIYGEMVSSKTEVKNFMLTSDLITAQSLGLVRIEGNPKFFNGENLGEVCVEIKAYVTKEDLKKFKPKEVRLQNYCFTDQNIPFKDIKNKARESAFLEIIKKHNPSLSNISEEEARKLIHEFNPIKENFDYNTGAYCMDVTAKIIPFELEFYKKGGGIKKTGTKTGRFVKNSSGTVSDNLTGLEWFAGPNKDQNWYAAREWVKSLKTAGGGWRMPTIDELKTLYEKGKGTHNMTPLLKFTGYFVWSREYET